MNARAHTYTHTHHLTTYEAGILQHFLFSILFGSQVGKRIDNDTENQVLDDDDDDQKEERQVIEDSKEKQRLLHTALG